MRITGFYEMRRVDFGRARWARCKCRGLRHLERLAASAIFGGRCADLRELLEDERNTRNWSADWAGNEGSGMTVFWGIAEKARLNPVKAIEWKAKGWNDCPDTKGIETTSSVPWSGP